ncbi:ferrochelatase [Brevibacillus brevis NBRC 100599]|uniref:Coproporphyrin III ferrochelatase n=1 Tax=Brevibacillus brevis (strain 47 / JCM 6285 / NBRC 100599) TaxID=358681 RepID=C0ZAI3_BREBN|nr:ferrochelatase [Brevibacillus brevis]BAH42792.1 ferrochelatase [Brevibacillus brevis NBRC 100599]
MSKQKIGLLLMAYGTPRSPEQIEPYYTHIRRGRKPPQELLDDLMARYEAVDGLNRFADITDEQVRALEQEMNKRYPDREFVGYLGLKHIAPFVEDAVEQMKRDGITEAISLVLAPHYSSYSVKEYNGRAQEHSAAIGGSVIHSIESWYLEPGFIGYWADAIQATFAAMTDEERGQAVVIFSAHSLPEKILKSGDPYPTQLEETAKLIAEQAGITSYAIGWQSAGNTPDPWLGPDVQDLTRELYEAKGYQAFVYCPVGFVAEHLEVLFDNDVECKAVTDELGVHYYRPAMPNARPAFISCLADAVGKKLAN